MSDNKRKNDKRKQSDKSKKSHKEVKILKDPTKSIPKRVNLLFFVIFVLFMILIGKLFNMQVLNSHFYAEKSISAGGDVQIIEGAPRGNIYDATGKALVSTVAVQAVEFTRSQNATADEMYQVANKLATILSNNIDVADLTTRDKKDYFLANSKNLEKIANSLSEKEKKDKHGNDLTGSQIYDVELSKVKDSDLNFTAEQTFAAKLFKEMNSTTTFNTTKIATGSITAEQQATIAEQEGDLPGITIGTSWDRSYAQNSLTPLMGTITSQKSGIPAEDLDAYLKKGYQRNDRVGTGLLEKGYESELQGTHNISKVKFDKNGDVSGTKTIQKGKRGDDLKLTINLDFQNGVNNIVKTQLDQLIAQGYGQYNRGAYAVVLNVKTGAVLALSGYQRDPNTGTITENTLGTFQSVFTPGSVVKMGTLTAAWNAGVISGNDTLTAQSIQFKDSPSINDWWGDASPMALTAVEALQYSSNTYMMQLAMRMLGAPYTAANQFLDDTNRVKVYEQFRKAFASYGLGASTGFDIPGESTGYLPSAKSEEASGVNVLYESFGQYDNYTPLQLAVYAATLGNNGTRLAPHIVQGIYEGGTDGQPGTLIKNITPKIMDKVNITPDNMDVLHQGMYAVVHGAGGLTTGRSMDSSKVSISGKTGTSESTKVLADGSQVIVTANNAVAFAPSDNPEIAIAVVLPDNTESNASSGTKANQSIVTGITDLYYSNEAFRKN
ncbi:MULTISPECIES: penicillin-binding transpeptidase domain-containing protein [Lactococcus]|jgi:penicillin-binding protein 2B|uniref:Penicillin-binding transpeptidase domain-containing protein n=1 Tax=Lactococcus lactis TaxID=1358 RepID=A0AAW8UB90_9LACT|nr:penicillin-binding transpeptidase domain-containing protein [Lactococcus lactis]MDT2870104.1 penicillin-binding transpeptidase domain-containing protein [Lactococcus lactis]MDT2875552.1 penicillin-binding transpeptidase domain-containing protein [Lactococcus lactis]MDT2880698.1 penicillin-binding transpeptidase domain-containing protein [Lactococcus lactis]MDT2886508.1 penicillin-binding transpeptidase domain-containing protein [Lactococcus lactis]MDT2891748.1 penicillin-binding transpeptid